MQAPIRFLRVQNKLPAKAYTSYFLLRKVFFWVASCLCFAKEPVLQTDATQQKPPGPRIKAFGGKSMATLMSLINLSGAAIFCLCFTFVLHFLHVIYISLHDLHILFTFSLNLFVYFLYIFLQILHFLYVVFTFPLHLFTCSLHFLHCLYIFLTLVYMFI